MAGFPTLKNIYDNKVIAINNTSFSLGRSLSCDHIISSIDVSRFHCVIKKTNDKWILYDRSSNGTYVNSTLVKFNENIDLHNGDSIRLGGGERLSFVFSQTANPKILESNVATASSIFRPEEEQLEEAAVQLVDSLVQPPFSYSHAFPKHEELPIDLSPAGGNFVSSQSTQVAKNCSPPIHISEEVVESTKIEDQSKPKIEDCKDNIAKDIPIVKKEVDSSSLDIMENELTCSICSEFFIKAVTLNCSHTFCKYCIDQWRKNKPNCPICRNVIMSTAPTLVVDNFIEKTLSRQSEEVKQTRRELIAQREEASKNIPGSSSSVSDLMNNDDDNNEHELDDIVIAISSDLDEYTEDFDSDLDYDEADYYDHDYFDFPVTRRSASRGTPYFGGYGRCYICNEEGHWANGCPNRRR